MNKKCPDCNEGVIYEETGICHPVTGMAEVIEHTCKKCKGTIPDDKEIQEAFDNYKNRSGDLAGLEHNESIIYTSQCGFRGSFISGRKSAEAEIKELKEDLSGRKQECIDYQETIMEQEAEIKRLRKLIKEFLDWWDSMYGLFIGVIENMREALKDGE